STISEPPYAALHKPHLVAGSWRGWNPFVAGEAGIALAGPGNAPELDEAVEAAEQEAAFIKVVAAVMNHTLIGRKIKPDEVRSARKAHIGARIVHGEPI